MEEERSAEDEEQQERAEEGMGVEVEGQQERAEEERRVEEERRQRAEAQGRKRLILRNGVPIEGSLGFSTCLIFFACLYLV